MTKTSNETIKRYDIPKAKNPYIILNRSNKFNTTLSLLKLLFALFFIFVAIINVRILQRPQIPLSLIHIKSTAITISNFNILPRFKRSTEVTKIV